MHNTIHLSRDDWGKLTLIDEDGMRHENVTPVRVFPITAPQEWISLVNRRGEELALIEDPHALPAVERSLVEEELARREFMPQIKQIVYVSSIMEPSEWEVVTNLGPTRFVLKSEDDVRRLSPHSGILIDAHGVRYLIRDTRQLDAYGRRALEQYI